MSKWSTLYTGQASKSVQSPVYVLAIAHDTATIKADITAASTSFAVDDNEGFSGLIHSPVLVWDDEHFEFMETTLRTSETYYVTRGQYGTYARAFEKGRTVFSPVALFSTDTVDDTTLPMLSGLMQFPAGGGQSLDLRNGRLTTDNLSVALVSRLCCSAVTRVWHSNTTRFSIWGA
jgi:hypothetical protein